MSAPHHYEEKGDGMPPPYPHQPQQGYSAQPPGYPAQPGYPPQQGYPPPGPQGYAPQQGYPQGQPMAYPVTGATVHTTNVVYTAQGGYGPDPVPTKCQYCQADIVTSTHYELGGLVWIIVGSLFIAGFFVLLTWLCCCIPCCIPSCKDVVHSCPNCKRQLGRYNRLN